MTLSVRPSVVSVGRLVCHNFLKEREKFHFGALVQVPIQDLIQPNVTCLSPSALSKVGGGGERGDITMCIQADYQP